MKNKLENVGYLFLAAGIMISLFVVNFITSFYTTCIVFGFNLNSCVLYDPEGYLILFFMLILFVTEFSILKACEE